MLYPVELRADRVGLTLKETVVKHVSKILVGWKYLNSQHPAPEGGTYFITIKALAVGSPSVQPAVRRDE